jgi:glutamyl-tRNA reductase
LQVGNVRRFVDISVPRNIAANINELQGQVSSWYSQMESCHHLQHRQQCCLVMRPAEQQVPSSDAHDAFWVQAIVYNVDDLKEVVAGNKEARAQVCSY